MQIKELDLQILLALRNNPIASCNMIAKKLSSSPKTVQSKISKMKEANILRKNEFIMDPVFGKREHSEVYGFVMPEKIIGLCRHLPIPDLPDKAWISSKQYRQWIQNNINVLPLPCSHITPFKDWEICFSSDMPRAVASAQLLASGMRLEKNPLFR